MYRHPSGDAYSAGLGTYIVAFFRLKLTWTEHRVGLLHPLYSDLDDPSPTYDPTTKDNNALGTSFRPGLSHRCYPSFTCPRVDDVNEDRRLSGRWEDGSRRGL